MQGRIGQNSKVIQIATAKDWNASAITTERINMKNCEKVRWVINCGVINASYAGAVTVKEALSDAAGQTLNLDYYDSISGETVTRTAVTSDTFDLATGHTGLVLVIEVKASDLSRTVLGSTSYDWVYLSIASSSYSAIYSVTAEVFGLKYGPDATVLA
jgi:hypothetical protein